MEVLDSASQQQQGLIGTEITKITRATEAETGRLAIEYGGLSFSFYRQGTSLAVGTLTPTAETAQWRIPQASLNYCREVELLITGEGRNFPARSRSLGGCGEQLRFVKLHEVELPEGRRFTLEYVRDDRQLRVFSHYLFSAANIAVVRRWVDVHNESTESVGLEYVASAVLYHMGVVGERRWDEKLRLHVPVSSWCGEAQWQDLSAADALVNAPDSGHHRAVCVGSRSSAERCPMAMVEDVESNITWFWQIEHSASWMWEVGNLQLEAEHGWYLLAGGPDDEHCQWYKRLQGGQSFSSVPVALGCVKGGFEAAAQELTRYRRRTCLKTHPVDKDLPIGFNDYMNARQGTPTLAKELPFIEAAGELGCEAFVIDSGWYVRPGQSWWSVGHWYPNEESFPGDDFEQVIECIRQTGMIPGIWIEQEVVAVDSPLAAKPDRWFLHRHGERVVYNRRYFLDHRQPEVRAHLHRVVDRLVDYGFGYIKSDYNVDLMQGADNDADSVGDGLLEHTRAVYSWLDEVAARHPELIWENCGAGGLRCDYGMLQRTQLQSVSDLSYYKDIPGLVVGCSATVLPEQLAIWISPDEDFNEHQTIYAMVNAMLARVHLSGRIDVLTPSCRALVKEALLVYRTIRGDFASSVPFYPLGRRTIMERSCYHALGMRCDEVSYLAIWRKDAPEGSCVLPLTALEEVTSVECIYPAGEQWQGAARLKGDVLTVSFDEPTTAGLFRLRHD